MTLSVVLQDHTHGTVLLLHDCKWPTYAIRCVNEQSKRATQEERGVATSILQRRISTYQGAKAIEGIDLPVDMYAHRH